MDDKVSGSSNNENDPDFQGNACESSDDEETLELEEKLESNGEKICYESEINELNEEANLPIEELLLRYGYGKDTEAVEEEEDDDDEISSESSHNEDESFSTSELSESCENDEVEKEAASDVKEETRENKDESLQANFSQNREKNDGEIVSSLSSTNTNPTAISNNVSSTFRQITCVRKEDFNSYFYPQSSLLDEMSFVGTANEYKKAKGSCDILGKSPLPSMQSTSAFNSAYNQSTKRCLSPDSSQAGNTNVSPASPFINLKYFFEVDSTSDSSVDEDYRPRIGEYWKKQIQVGTNFQCLLPNLVNEKKSESYAPEFLLCNPDTLIWNPNISNGEDINSFLQLINTSKLEVPSPRSLVSLISNQKIVHSVDTNGIDQQDQLKEITSSNDGAELEKGDVLPPSNPSIASPPQPTLSLDTLNAFMKARGCRDQALIEYRKLLDAAKEHFKAWSNLECLVFETGLQTFGKNFFKIKTVYFPNKTVGDIITFYYAWKKTPRYDSFISEFRPPRPYMFTRVLNPRDSEALDTKLLDSDSHNASQPPPSTYPPNVASNIIASSSTNIQSNSHNGKEVNQFVDVMKNTNIVNSASSDFRREDDSHNLDTLWDANKESHNNPALSHRHLHHVEVSDTTLKKEDHCMPSSSTDFPSTSYNMA